MLLETCAYNAAEEGDRGGLITLDAHLHDLSHPIRELAGGQRLQECGIDEDVLGLPERADEILAVRGINSGFPADARVDHRK